MEKLTESTITYKAASATIWSGTDLLARQGIQFAITLILARLLAPADYGTVALLSIFISLAGIFIESGFSSALIQRVDVSDIELSSVFYVNIGLAVLAAIALCVASSWIAAFYRIPVLKPLTWLLAIDLVIGAFGSVQRTLLTKALNFRRQCIISLIAVLTSGVVAVALALNGFGVWSLGVQTITVTSISTFLLWISSSWRPQIAFSVKEIRSLFRFGGYLLTAGLLDTLFTRLNTLVIGKLYSPLDLGYYSRADETRMAPTGFLSSVIGRVAFPMFAAIRERKDRLRSGLRRAVTAVMIVNIPMMLGMAATAEPLVRVLFGEKWTPCVPYLKILCLGGVLWPLHVLNLNILVAQGYSNLFFRLEVLKKVVGVALIGTGCLFGVVAIAWSSVITSAVCFAINAYYNGRHLNYGFIKQSIDMCPYLMGGIIMVCSLRFMDLFRLGDPWLTLAVQIPSGILIYIGYCRAFRLSGYNDSRELLRNLFSSPSKKAT